MSLQLSRRVAVTVSAAVVAAGLGGAGIGYAASAATGPAIQTKTPRSEKDVTNIDVLRQQLRNYYGDALGTGTFSDDSNYAREARDVAADGAKRLDKPNKKNKAIVLDVDDTTLATWNYEVASNWAYNPTTNATFVTEQRFPAVPGMVETVRTAEREGYAIFFLTGRPTTQEQATLGNLTADGVGVDAGYPKPTTLSDGEDGLFTKPAVADYPAYLTTACAADPNGSCTTIHYKSATRKHIESLGYDIVANFGDQDSDLKGGYADHTFKLPNPNYYLP
ncbi:HAD family acid phosphatase [Actinoplanes sp. N902-109]|uniref:HAD family acid phosphatase n=1 Tax=Actinoplanes sp. (strain N902-109) TaxID=649831 RepID=UPI0003296202|nr:HAD family acid phosphatase [Actinoplanes sp. N902-109]AGL20112.1 acid phosphatase (class B) [Actinoplanes sp. N902-109]